MDSSMANSTCTSSLGTNKVCQIINNFVDWRQCPMAMWQQSGTLPFSSCHGIAGFLVDELQF